MEKFILAFDAGTTSSRAIIFNKKGNIVAVAQKEFTQYFPQPGWVEHDANEIWSTQMSVAAEAVIKAKITMPQIAAIGITNQRETTVVWDKRTGEPVYHAIVWQDRRTATYCDALRKQGLADTIQRKTGLVMDAYFSATKLKWILDEVPGARANAENGHLCFGNIDAWLLWKLTNGKVFATDVSNASRTMLFNIHTLQWDDDLLQLMNIPPQILPQVKSSSEVYGVTHAILTHAATPVAAIAGDQQAALFGQMCTEPGMVKNTYGTGCFMLMQTGEKIVLSQHNLLTTIAWQINGKTAYALEGSVFMAGATVQWLRDGLGLIRHTADIEALAVQVKNTEGVYIVPAFAGLGAPYWNQEARGMLTGLTRGTNPAHIARAVIESIAYQTVDVLKAMEADSGIAIHELRVDGGATANQLLMQFQSNVLGCKVVKPAITETTALGAAYLAGLAVGFYSSRAEIAALWQMDRTFEPQATAAETNHLLEGWHRAVRATIHWANNTQ
ncbi:MAG: glycerol kinase GlpK [Hydrotalea flava]|nr:glycerol kinase GlpK [Hydrotalea flava]NIM38685.1 glycerol kinase GlpK [Hydrotalea flava]NIN03873.1 glycerol kinase GlpK [Hydrotalea flava]NIN15594.1 glycerol kinase GlpK [Hydrotalea flava]NIO94611.1 glycerol kinase GlpK [Hydrotalea flava]